MAAKRLKLIQETLAAEDPLMALAWALASVEATMGSHSGKPCSENCAWRAKRTKAHTPLLVLREARNLSAISHGSSFQDADSLIATAALGCGLSTEVPRTVSGLLLHLSRKLARGNMTDASQLWQQHQRLIDQIEDLSR